ncbi:MAG: signal peptidase II [Polyangiaceae bacterium]
MQKPRSPLFQRLALALFTASLVGCDHVTKHVAERSLAGTRPLSVVPGWLDLRYTQNFDTAFSLTRPFAVEHKPIVLAIVALAMLALVAVLWWQHRAARWPVHAGFGLIVGGALGNALDRIFRGYVVDFVHLAHWPVFNVADVAVVAGALLLMLDQLRNRRGMHPPNTTSS